MRQQNLGLRLKEGGLDAVEHSNESWVEGMRKFAKRFSEQFGQVNADDVRRYSRKIGWHPESPNAFGAVFRGQGWRAIGRTKSEWPGNHGREIKVWRWAL